MTSFLNLAFIVLWMIIGFLAFLAFFNAVFVSKKRAWIPAIAVVISFTVGFNWPSAPRDQAAFVPPPSPVAIQLAFTPRMPNSKLRDLSSNCIGVPIPETVAFGFLDSVESNLGPLSSGAVVSGSLPLSISGWAVVGHTMKPAVAVCLVVDGKVDVKTRVEYGFSRPDVATSLSLPTLQNVGYTIFTRPYSLSVGSHQLKVFAISSSRQTFLLQGQFKVTVY